MIAEMLKEVIRPRSRWNVRCYDKFGNLKWEELDLGNIWHDEGEEFVVDCLFDETQSVPVNYYLGLDARPALAEADNLAALSGEPSGDGYAREAVASDNTDWTNSKVGDNWRATSKEVTFTASGGDWSAVLNLFLATSSDGTGKLLCSVALSESRTIKDDDSLVVSLYVSVA